MKRRSFLLAGGTAALTVASFSKGWAAATQDRPRKILYFTRSVSFEHSVVRREGGELSHSEKILTSWGEEYGVQVDCTKDGRVFDGDLDGYDVIAFYTAGDLCVAQSKDNSPPMSPEGKKKLLAAVANGKGFVGIHAACDSFHSFDSEDGRNKVQEKVDPYIAMVGGEFIKHGPQQTATNTVTSPSFPGAAALGASIQLHEEWYTMKNFAQDMHVILVQETEGMQGPCYQRPPFPGTWIRKHGQGRVFFTSLGHREDVWTNPLFKGLMIGGFAWVAGARDADVTPNIAQVAPKANQLAPSI